MHLHLRNRTHFGLHFFFWMLLYIPCTIMYKYYMEEAPKKWSWIRLPIECYRGEINCICSLAIGCSYAIFLTQPFLFKKLYIHGHHYQWIWQSHYTLTWYANFKGTRYSFLWNFSVLSRWVVLCMTSISAFIYYPQNKFEQFRVLRRKHIRQVGWLLWIGKSSMGKVIEPGQQVS